MAPRWLFLKSIVIASLAPAAIATCQWYYLRNAADIYLDSQTNGELDETLLAPGVQYRENNQVMDIRKGILGKPLSIDLSRTIFDQPNCAMFSELVVANNKDSYVIATQIRFNNDNDVGFGSGVTIALVDSIVTTTGDWQFNASKTLELAQKEDWSPFSQPDQDTRDLIKSVADSYLDLWGNSTSSVPWDASCTLVEGAVTSSCGTSLPAGNQKPNTDRRYVIDPSVGSINVFSSFGSLGNAMNSHEFRVESGKLRYIHRITTGKPNGTSWALKARYKRYTPNFQ